MRRPHLRSARAARLAPAALATLAAAGSAPAQPPAAPAAGAGAPSAAALPPIRPLGPVEAEATELLGALVGVRELPGRRVLANDSRGRRVVLFDSALTSFTVVADSTSATGSAYGGRFGGLIPFGGDSTLFVDPQSLSMLVIDPGGKLGRVLSVPRPNDAMALTGLTFGVPGFDARGRLVYRAAPSVELRMRAGEGPPRPPQPPDSAPLLRVDLATRRVDTVTFVRTPAPRMTMTEGTDGRPSVTVTTNPLPEVDDWAVLRDGTVAVLRGRDFRVDLFGADGPRATGVRVPHEWQRLDDDAKVAFLDSTRAAMERTRAQLQAAGGDPTRAAAAMAGGAGGAGSVPMVVTMRVGDGEPPRRGEARAPGGGPGGGAAGAATLPPINLVSPAELPDYRPAFGPGAARADVDGRVWVRLLATKPMPGPVYAVIDGEGRLVDRVLLPAGTAIAGFGAGGVVYLGAFDQAAGGVRLRRARAR